VRTLLEGLGELTGTSWSDEDLEDLLDHLRGAQGFVRGTLQDTSNVTMLDAGYKHNVIPQHASANVDCRFLPGHEEQLLATITELAGEHVSVEVLHRDIALDAPFEGDLVEAMVAALRTEDPDAVVLPYCLSGGTDNKALSLLGITGYGFAPLRLPADLDFAPMFHGVDERGRSRLGGRIVTLTRYRRVTTTTTMTTRSTPAPRSTRSRLSTPGWTTRTSTSMRMTKTTMMTTMMTKTTAPDGWATNAS
jgi:hypothetical protein